MYSVDLCNCERGRLSTKPHVPKHERFHFLKAYNLKDTNDYWPLNENVVCPRRHHLPSRHRIVIISYRTLINISIIYYRGAIFDARQPFLFSPTTTNRSRNKIYAIHELETAAIKIKTVIILCATRLHFDVACVRNFFFMSNAKTAHNGFVSSSSSFLGFSQFQFGKNKAKKKSGRYINRFGWQLVAVRACMQIK